MHRSHRELRRLAVGLTFASPWIVGFLCLQLYPSLASLYYSFTSFNTLQPPRWIGLDNFRTLFTNDPLFWIAVRNTLFMASISVPLGILLALGFAILLNQPHRGVTWYRAAIYAPVLVPPVVSTLIWAWILNPANGLLNTVLGVFHIPQPGWLTNPSWSKPALIIMGLWAVGGAMVIILAGLQDVPVHLHEAAMIDGAGPLLRFWRITLPNLSPVLFYNVVVAVIYSLQYFTQAYVAVGANCYGGSGNCLGQPVNSLLVYGVYLYQNAFLFFKMGYASAMAWILFVITLLATALLFRFSRRLVFYEGASR